MNRESSIENEFKRLYSNVKELYRRIISQAEYPKQTCGTWFVNHVEELIRNPNYMDKLSELNMVQLEAMIKVLIGNDEILENDQDRLVDMLEYIEDIKTKGANL